MKISVVYVYPMNGRDGRRSNAERFLSTYLELDPGVDHELVVACNGEEPNADTRSLFEPVPNLRFFNHDNSGYDIGAFQHAARDIPCDMMVFFGNSAYVRLPKWLKRMSDVSEQNGLQLYGSMQNAGHIAAGVWPHIRTSGFWMDPKILLSYPMLITQPHERYPFEHGRDCLTSFCKKNFGVLSVTSNGTYPMSHWLHVPEGYHDGNQSALLTGDRMTCPPFYITS